MFLTFEGGEGTGKTTQIAHLASHLRAAGHDVRTYREPGGSQGAEAIRELVLTGPPERWDAVEELLLFSAARHTLVRTAIAPDLAAGRVVLCDRFYDSTRVYQGRAGGLDAAPLDVVETLATNGLKPDLTILLDLDPQIGLARAGQRLADLTSAESRFESKTLAFHTAVRAAFLERAKAEPARIKTLNADQAPDALAAQIWDVVQTHISAHISAHMAARQ